MIREYLKMKKQKKIEQLLIQNFEPSAQNASKSRNKHKEFFTRTYNFSLDLVNDSEEEPKYRRKSPEFSASFLTKELRKPQVYARSRQ